MKNNQSGAARIRTIIGGGAVALLLLAGVFVGPDLVGFYRFNQALDRMAADNTANAGEWPQTQEVCAICHGRHGNAATQLYPRLAGQPAAYLAQQLQAFASSQRPNAWMSPLARTMSAEEIQRIADYYAAQPPARNDSFVADPALVAKGEALAKAGACSACHGNDLAGRDQFPRLAGQGYDYLVDQLTTFKNGQRKDASGAMNGMVANLSSEDIQQLAHYLASHP